MEQMKKPTAATVGSSGNTLVCNDSTPLVSGLGAYHSNEDGCKTPRPYLSVTMSEIKGMVIDPQQVPKERARWFIPSSLLSRSHAEQLASGRFVALWQDFDKDATVYDVATRCAAITGDADFLCYASRSSTEAVRKCRVIIPVSQTLTGADWVMAQTVLADAFDEAGLIADRAATRPGQLAYLPNRNPEFYDADYVWDGHRIDPVALFADRIARLQETAAKANAEAEVRRKAASERLERFKSSGATSAIAAFNLSHTCEEVLLAAGYERKGQDFRHPNSESGSYSCNVKDGIAYSLSPSDPLSGRARDAFGCYAMLNHGGDVTAAAKTVYAKMKEAA